MKTLLEIVPALKKKNQSEYAGPCPWCGGHDRFVVWPQKSKGGRYYCRQCVRHGDAIDFLREEGMSFRDACKELDIGCTPRPYRKPVAKVAPVAVASVRGTAPDISPSMEWKTMAASIVKECINSTDFEVVTHWKAALAKRHINMSTGLRYGIGWNHRDRWIPSDRLGDAGRRIRIPKGLLVPIWRKKGIVGMKVGCADTKNDPKVWNVKGSGRQNLLIGKSGIPVFIVESDLDAYLIAQEAGDMVSVVSLGGATNRLDKESLNFVAQAKKVYISTDFDEGMEGTVGAGQKAYMRLMKDFPHAEYMPTARGKDPCEMHDMGITVRSWVMCALGPACGSIKIPLPVGCPISSERLKKCLQEYPLLVPCPKTHIPWSWIYRRDCSSCAGHVHCLKDLKYLATEFIV